MPLTLRQLEARFMKRVDDKASNYLGDSAVDADGVFFLCPKCFEANGNSNVGTHGIICWFKGRVPDSQTPGPGRWNPSGTTIDDLSLVPPGMCSVQLNGGCSAQLNGGCSAHFHVTNGMILNC